MRTTMLAVGLVARAANLKAPPSAPPPPREIEDVVGKPAPHFSPPSARDDARTIVFTTGQVRTLKVR